jgi:hypothetical protein
MTSRRTLQAVAFLSYAREADSEIARRLEADLRRFGRSLFERARLRALEGSPKRPVSSASLAPSSKNGSARSPVRRSRSSCNSLSKRDFPAFREGMLGGATGPRARVLVQSASHGCGAQSTHGSVLPAVLLRASRPKTAPSSTPKRIVMGAPSSGTHGSAKSLASARPNTFLTAAPI